ncbi:MAG: flavin reductase family protein, partial [Betaproteobacteria bacterium]|nr:flavin reductase family protein [Betaproteobacteria bacterium]
MLFDFSKLNTKERYKIMACTVVPRPIAWITTVGQDGSRNAAPFSFFNVMSSAPPIVAIGFTERSPVGKDTLKHIQDTGQFVVNLVPANMVEAMNITAIEFPPVVDEIDEAQLSVTPSTFVKPPRISESPVAMECQLFQLIPLPSGQSIVLGQVLGTHIRDDSVTDEKQCYINTAKLDLIGRMDGRDNGKLILVLQL